MLTLRPYQQAAVDAVYKHLRERNDNPCVVLPTGTGKSLVIAQLVRDAVERWNGRVLILAHVKELLEQNAGKIKILCPDIRIGIYSAGLKSRDTEESVIVAGIQSVYDKACDLGAFDLIVVDEAHLIPPDGDGMYRSFLNDMLVVNPHVRLIGLTATPFRLKGGLICKPENLLNAICYEAGLKEMIQQGYLSPLTSRAGRAEANLDDLHIRGGEFIGDEIAAAMDTEQLVSAACHEIADLTRDRKSVLIFTSGVDHCKHVAAKITEYTGRECAIVTGNTPDLVRDEIIRRFKGEVVADDLFGTPKPPLKFLCNVNVLTTGFDAPNTDCIVLLRPTNSAGLLIQMVGRGTRLSPETGKTNCLVLDYGGNILRHGPVDMIRVTDRTPGDGDAPAKKCPKCLALIHAAYQTCPECGYEFPAPQRTKLTDRASRDGIISGETFTDVYEVTNVYYQVHEKRYAEPPDRRTRSAAQGVHRPPRHPPGNPRRGVSDRAAAPGESRGAGVKERLINLRNKSINPLAIKRLESLIKGRAKSMAQAKQQQGDMKMEAKITVTRTEKAINVWTMATAEVGSRKYYIEMVRFDEPSIHGIRKGRISKLWVRGEDGTVVINYDRGWDIRPTTDEAKALLKEITKRFN